MTILTNGAKFRPKIHFTPEANWMNDPNGMVYYDGEYHLFYQYHPDGTTWGPMHWGHAVSKDLLLWEHLPIGLAPDGDGFIFSGSAVVDWRDSSGLFQGGPGLVAIFTHHDEHPETGGARQRQSIAYSTDRGRTWTKYAGNPVLTEESVVDFRDPKVFWHETAGHWVMAIAAGDHIRFYTSANLIDWTFASEFGRTEGSHDGVWECPDLFELSVEGEPGMKRWVLIVSIGDHPDCPEGSRTQYFVGGFDGYTFVNGSTPETILWLDYGRDNYAGVSWSDVPDEDGRRIMIGWMSNWKYANMTPTTTWRGAMTVPREMSMRREREGIRLIQRPVSELALQRRNHQRVTAERVSPEQALAMRLADDTPHEINVELQLRDAERVSLRLVSSADEETVIGYDAGTASLFIDRTNSGIIDFHEQFGCKHEAGLQLEDGRLALRIWLDRSSIEVFANDGAVAMTDLIFPRQAIHSIVLAAVGGEAGITDLTLYALRAADEEVSV